MSNIIEYANNFLNYLSISEAQHLAPPITEPTVLENENSWETEAVKVLKVVGCIVLFAGVTAGTGSLLQFAGTHLITNYVGTSSLAGSILGKVGSLSLYSGDRLFFIGWSAPKWVLTQGIPQGSLYFKETLSYAIVTSSKWVWNVVIIPSIVELAPLGNLIKDLFILTLIKAVCKNIFKQTIVVPTTQTILDAVGLKKDANPQG